MKHHSFSAFAIALVLCVGGLTACASNQAKNPLPPVTSLNSEPTPFLETNQPAPAAPLAAHSPHVNTSAPEPAPPAANTYSAVIAPASAAIVMSPAPVNPQQNRGLSETNWFWIILLLALLVLMAALQEIQARKKKREADQIGVLLSHKEPPVNETTARNTASGELVPDDKKISPFHKVIRSASRIRHFSPKNALLFLKTKKNSLVENHFINPSLAQKEVRVTAFYNDQIHKMHFSRGTTIKKVTGWAAYQFEIAQEDVPEMYLTIHGYFSPLDINAHLGRFIPHHENNLELDVRILAKTTKVLSV
jgi:hypothetical protein